MIEVIRQRRVDALPERVWQLVDDPVELARWFSFAESIEHLDGQGLGRRQRQHGRWGKKRSEIEQEVTRYEPPNLLAWRHIEERLDGKPAPQFARSTEAFIELHADGSGTRVVLRSVQEPAGTLKGLVIRLFGKREVARHFDRSLDALAQLVRSDQPT
jgi:uncharacterized protein YndB with AHSA1/START domain